MLALIAGEGALPRIVFEAVSGPVQVYELEGHASQLRDAGAISFRVERLGSFIAGLKANGITQVCFAGAIARPALDPSMIDPATMPLVPRMMQALQQGDDAALRIVIAFFEEAGMQVVAAHELARDLLPKAGDFGEVERLAQDETDAERGFEILAAMGALDVGQACIISKGQVLALEAMGGTDWMMRSLLGPFGTLPLESTLSADPISWAADWLTGPEAEKPRLERDPALPPGGLLIKARKPDQDQRIDMPTIGPETFTRAAEVGMRGVVIEAGGVQVLDLVGCIDLARTHNLLFWVR